MRLHAADKCQRCHVVRTDGKFGVLQALEGFYTCWSRIECGTRASSFEHRASSVELIISLSESFDRIGSSLEHRASRMKLNVKRPSAIAEHLSAICRNCIDSQSNVYRRFVETISTICRTSVDNLSSPCRQSVKLLAAVCRAYIDDLSSFYRRSVDRLSTLSQVV